MDRWSMKWEENYEVSSSNPNGDKKTLGDFNSYHQSKPWSAESVDICAKTPQVYCATVEVKHKLTEEHHNHKKETTI